MLNTPLSFRRGVGGEVKNQHENKSNIYSPVFDPALLFAKRPKAVYKKWFRLIFLSIAFREYLCQ